MYICNDSIDYSDNSIKVQKNQRPYFLVHVLLHFSEMSETVSYRVHNKLS